VDVSTSGHDGGHFDSSSEGRRLDLLGHVVGASVRGVHPIGHAPYRRADGLPIGAHRGRREHGVRTRKVHQQIVRAVVLQDSRGAGRHLLLLLVVGVGGVVLLLLQVRRGGLRVEVGHLVRGGHVRLLVVLDGRTHALVHDHSAVLVRIRLGRRRVRRVAVVRWTLQKYSIFINKKFIK
jgi:hypothetical protein